MWRGGEGFVNRIWVRNFGLKNGLDLGGEHWRWRFLCYIDRMSWDSLEIFHEQRFMNNR